MDPTIQNLQNQVASLTTQLTALTTQFNFHKHTGADLSSKIDIPAAQQVYGGFVNSGGTTGTPFPSGWTVATPGAGRYTITHNLATTNYSVVVSNKSAFSNVGSIVTLGSNSMEIDMYNNTVGATWSATNTSFFFILVVQS